MRHGEGKIFGDWRVAGELERRRAEGGGGDKPGWSGLSSPLQLSTLHILDNA